MKRDIRLIAIDLDGTLLNSQQRVTPASRAALQRAAGAGIQIIFATGRGLVGAETVLGMVEMDLPYICSAGSLIRSGRKGEVISARPFHNPFELNRVIAYVRRNNAGLVADLPDGKMCWYGPDWLMESLDHLTAESMRDSLRTFTPEQDFDRPILKMSIAGEMDFLNAIDVEVLGSIDSLHHVYAGLHYMDLTALDVDKGSALKIYADKMHIPLTAVAAIGDQPIDLPMLGSVGLSIAMGNAQEKVRAGADWIAPSNDQEGIAWVLAGILEEIQSV